MIYHLKVPFISLNGHVIASFSSVFCVPALSVLIDKQFLIFLTMVNNTSNQNCYTVETKLQYQNTITWAQEIIKIPLG